MGAPSVGESYYAVLGVARDATPEEVRAAFRAVALDTHPDSGAAGAAAPEAAARFQHAKEAYDVLRRADSRADDGEWMGPGMRARVDAARRWRAKRDARAQSHAERSASAEAAMGAEEANEAEELLKRFRESERHKRSERAQQRSSAGGAAAWCWAARPSDA
eukprot:PRCOL_00006513-RA